MNGGGTLKKKEKRRHRNHKGAPNGQTRDNLGININKAVTDYYPTEIEIL